MSALESRIRDLVSFARNKDGDDRTSLYLNLTDLMLTGQIPEQSQTRAQLLEVVTALIPHVDAEARREIAERLASMPEPPMDLVGIVIEDRANLVSSLLTFAPFDEDELVDVIGRTGRDHHQILATRTDLTANAWIALARAAPTPQKPASPLALWRDGLAGVSNACIDEAKDILRAGEKEAPHPSRSAKRRPPQDRPKAKLRILRLDKDIEAEDESNTGPDGSARPEPYETSTRADKAPPGKRTRGGSAGYSVPSGAQAKRPEDQNPLTDPAPGGWAWRSDRDGFVRDLSPAGPQILQKPLSRLKGAPMLDLLGLNAKLGHPIARGLQRRSTIHDAPLYLASLDKNYRYWTLDALPLFDPETGVFEGYEGQLMPVKPEITASDTPVPDADMLFMDEGEDLSTSFNGDRPASYQRAPEPPLAEEAVIPEEVGMGQPALTDPATFSLDALGDIVSSNTVDLVRSVIADSMKSEPQKGPAARPQAEHPIVQQDQQIRQTVPIAPEPNVTPAPLDAPAPSLAADILSSLRLDSFDPIGSSAPDGQEQAQATPQAATRPTSNPHSATEIDGLERTLGLLEQAIDTLLDQSRATGQVPMRLQAEIAAACLRVLRDQLTSA